MKYIFIVNPSAGEENNLEKIKKEISNNSLKDDCEIYVTKSLKDGAYYVKTYCEDHKGQEVRFIACGGDGTLSAVFNAVVGYDFAEVSCYPCGSGNDFVKTFGGTDKFLNIDALLNAKTQKIDLLKIDDMYSNNVVNFGFDTTVALTVNEGREKNGKAGKSLYTLGIIKALAISMKNKFKVYADGELLNPDGIGLLCTLANGQYVGGSFKCAPRAKVNDGLIEVCLVKPISRLSFVSLIDYYTKGKHLDDPKFEKIIVYRQAKKVDVEAPEGFAYSLDGEIIKQNKFTVEIVPEIVKFAIPE